MKATILAILFTAIVLRGAEAEFSFTSRDVVPGSVKTFLGTKDTNLGPFVLQFRLTKEAQERLQAFGKGKLDQDVQTKIGTVSWSSRWRIDTISELHSIARTNRTEITSMASFLRAEKTP